MSTQRTRRSGCGRIAGRREFLNHRLLVWIEAPAHIASGSTRAGGCRKTSAQEAQFVMTIGVWRNFLAVVCLVGLAGCETTSLTPPNLFGLKNQTQNQTDVSGSTEKTASSD